MVKSGIQNRNTLAAYLRAIKQLLYAYLYRPCRHKVWESRAGSGKKTATTELSFFFLKKFSD